MRAGDGGRSPTALLGRAIGRSSGCPLPAGRGELAPSSSRTAQEVPFGRLLGAAARQRQHSASKAARPQWNPPFCDGRHGGLRLCLPTSQCGPLGGPIGQSTAMERFIRRENMKRFRKLLLEAKDDAERRRLQKLLIEEEQKESAAETPSPSTAPRLSDVSSRRLLFERVSSITDIECSRITAA